MSKYEKLKHFLRKYSTGGIAIAFSGGVDSSLLLNVLKELRQDFPFHLLALTVHSIFQRPEELEKVQEATIKAGIEPSFLAVIRCQSRKSNITRQIVVIGASVIFLRK